jgi:hypothetical protein
MELTFKVGDAVLVLLDQVALILVQDRDAVIVGMEAQEPAGGGLELVLEMNLGAFVPVLEFKKLAALRLLKRAQVRMAIEVLTKILLRVLHDTEDHEHDEVEIAGHKKHEIGDHA